MRYTLYNKDTQEPIGPLTSAQRQDLIDYLVEEHADDRDYFIDRAAFEHLELRGADADILHELVRQCRDMHEPVLVYADINEGSERGYVRDHAFEDHAGLQIGE